jgi:valyl-tRNA synthetase
MVSESLVDDAAEREFALVQELVSAIREIRSAQLVADRKQIVLHIADDATGDLITRAGGVVEALAGLETVTRDAAPGDAVPFVFGNGEHALSGLRDQVDTGAERSRLSKQRDELTKRIGGLNGRLSNEAYISKAPAKLVDETRAQLSQAQSELESTQQALARLGGD